DYPRCVIHLRTLQAHRDGEEIKFYGVCGGFFLWFYSGQAPKYSFNFAELEDLANRAATSAGLDIFGGDVIVSSSGELTLIDLNDWPSFAPCRERASYAIADFITRRIHAA